MGLWFSCPTWSTLHSSDRTEYQHKTENGFEKSSVGLQFSRLTWRIRISGRDENEKTKPKTGSTNPMWDFGSHVQHSAFCISHHAKSQGRRAPPTPLERGPLRSCTEGVAVARARLHIPDSDHARNQHKTERLFTISKSGLRFSRPTWRILHLRPHRKKDLTPKTD